MYALRPVQKYEESIRKWREKKIKMGEDAHLAYHYSKTNFPVHFAMTNSYFVDFYFIPQNAQRNRILRYHKLTAFPTYPSILL